MTELECLENILIHQKSFVAVIQLHLRMPLFSLFVAGVLNLNCDSSNIECQKDFKFVENEEVFGMRWFYPFNALDSTFLIKTSSLKIPHPELSDEILVVRFKEPVLPHSVFVTFESEIGWFG